MIPLPVQRVTRWTLTIQSLIGLYEPRFVSAGIGLSTKVLSYFSRVKVAGFALKRSRLLLSTD
jgi:hypothetical protein